jgi:hypothetical protein
MAMMEPRGAIIQATRSSVPPNPAGRTRHGRVLSVHHSAVNLVVGEDLLTVACDAVGGLPSAILVPDGFAPGALGVRRAARVQVDEMAVDLGGLVTVRTVGADRWSPRLRPIGSARADLDARAALARAALRGAGDDGFRGLVAGSEPVHVFLRAADRRDVTAVSSAGDALIGLGAGLTPAGDDLLVGFSAALTAGGHPASRPLAVRWAARAAGMTTDVALAYHRHAARADYAERLHLVLGAILQGALAGIAPAVDRATRSGATSGVDLMSGVLAGIDLLAARSHEHAA